MKLRIGRHAITLDIATCDGPPIVIAPGADDRELASLRRLDGPDPEMIRRRGSSYLYGGVNPAKDSRRR